MVILCWSTLYLETSAGPCQSQLAVYYHTIHSMPCNLIANNVTPSLPSLSLRARKKSHSVTFGHCFFFSFFLRRFDYHTSLRRASSIDSPCTQEWEAGLLPEYGTACSPAYKRVRETRIKKRLKILLDTKLKLETSMVGQGNSKIKSLHGRLKKIFHHVCFHFVQQNTPLHHMPIIDG